MEKREIQAWCIGYREWNAWRTINLPGERFISEEMVEKLLDSINKESDIVYSRKFDGALEKTRFYAKKGCFLGLYL